MSRDVVWVRARPALRALAFGIGALVPIVIGAGGGTRFVPRPHVVEVGARVPAPRAAEAPPVVVAPPRTACPIPLAHIGLAGTQTVDANGPVGLRGVAASGRGCTVVTWTASDVLVSRDDGASFTRLAAVGPGAPVTSVAVDDDERLLVIRGGHLEIEAADGAMVARALPDPSFERVAASGRWIVLVGPALVAVSEDGGAAWRIQRTPVTVMASAARVDDDGTLHLAAAVGVNEPVTYHVGDVRGAAAWRPVWTSPPHRAWQDPYNTTVHETRLTSIDAFAFGRDGRLYASVQDAYGPLVFVVDAAGAVVTADKLAHADALRGAAIASTSVALGARDSHGLQIVPYQGRGPIRIDDRPWVGGVGGFPLESSGRWLVGGVVPP